MEARKQFRVTVQAYPSDMQAMSIITGIQVNVPAGLTRHEAVDYVTGVVAKEFSRYAAWEALGLGSVDNDTDYSEKVT